MSAVDCDLYLLYTVWRLKEQDNTEYYSSNKTFLALILVIVFH